MDSHHIHTREFKGSTKRWSEFLTDTIKQCLTEDCKDCTGSYSNDLLHHRLICLCHCHREEQKAAGLVGATGE
jgi:hypothetical protein